jgi:choline dehydrogenase-like flavoprotein
LRIKNRKTGSRPVCCAPSIRGSKTTAVTACGGLAFSSEELTIGMRSERRMGLAASSDHLRREPCERA